MIRPKTNMVTEAPQTAVLRPNLSDTRPAEKEPRAKPKIKIIIIEIVKAKVGEKWCLPPQNFVKIHYIIPLKPLNQPFSPIKKKNLDVLGNFTKSSI